MKASPEMQMLRLNSTMQSLKDQREQALDAVVALRADNEMLGAQNRELEAKVQTLEAKLKALEKPEEAAACSN